MVAWTEPSQAPPNGNTPSPLNVSSIGQAKSGGLILNTGGAVAGLIVDKGLVGIKTLVNCDTIDTDASGNLKCGSDADSISFYDIIQSQGSSVQQRPTLNFIGAGVTCGDDGSKTFCNIPGGGGGGTPSMGWERVANSCSSANSCSASCTGGKKLLGGGCLVVGGGTALAGSIPLGDSAWLCSLVSPWTDEIQVNAICATLP